MQATTFQFELMTPVGVQMTRELKSAIIPTTMGIIQVLPEHTELVSVVEPGELIVETPEGEKESLVIAGGVIEMVNNHLRILADTALPASDIDLASAELEAERLAKELATEEKMDITTYTMLQNQLAAEHAKLAVGRKWRA